MIENVIYSCRETISVLLCNGIHWHVSVRHLSPWGAQTADQLIDHAETTLARILFSVRSTPLSKTNLCDMTRENTNIYETYLLSPRKSIKH